MIPTGFDKTTLHRMYLTSGISALQSHPEAEGITLVRTAKGNEYHFPFSFQASFVPEAVAALTGAEDIHIQYLLHIWKDRTLDVPAYSLRKALMALHPNNRDALLMLAGKTGFALLPLGDTMR